MAENKEWGDLRDTKAWLEQTGLYTEYAGDIEPPPFPYQVFEEIQTTAGPDFYPNALVYHDISVEQYQETDGRTHVETLEALLDACGLDYIHDRVWLSSEKMWMDTFAFRIIEKNPIE